jgi:hypothetical protein
MWAAALCLVTLPEGFFGGRGQRIIPSGWAGRPKPRVRWGMLKFGPKFARQSIFRCMPIRSKTQKPYKDFGRPTSISKNSADEQVPSIPVGFLSALWRAEGKA